MRYYPLRFTPKISFVDRPYKAASATDESDYLTLTVLKN